MPFRWIQPPFGRVLPGVTPDARIALFMTMRTRARPRVGVPWRSATDEAANRHTKMGNYLRAIERAGGEAVLLSVLSGAEDLKRRAKNLDAFVLAGSSADIDPAHFRAKRHPATADADPARERTDFTLLEHAMGAGKPVLAICYGIQSLNVFLGGSLMQDIPSELGSKVCHSPGEDEVPGHPEPADALHTVQFDPGRVLNLSGAPHVEVNSSHHQSVLDPGRGLRITARAPDGVVEAVEWTEDSNWIMGVQWHPERMPEDALAQALFRGLLSAALRE
jgi:putative glutamine amidotransferase